MGKKYLNTKEGSIEQSILDVWQEAADMHAEGMDGRTKEYRSHRGKLESNRVKRENKKNSVKTEQPETLDGAGEHAFEVGTDRYREHTQKMTPGQMEEENENLEEVPKALRFVGAVAKAGAKTAWKKTKDQAVSAVLGKGTGKIKGAIKKVKKAAGTIKKTYQAAEYDPTMEKENMTENRNLVNTIKNLWIEAAAAAVDPNDREELDKEPDGRGGVESAKKMKRAKEPAPNVSEGVDLDEGTKEEYQKFFNAAMKKFKINSPADLKSDEEKKKFFDYVDKNYKGEKSEDKKIELAKEFKVSSMRQAMEKVWKTSA